MSHLPPLPRPAFDNVKIAVEDGHDHDRFYFARCVAFFKYANDDVFVALRWYSEVPGIVVDPS